MAGKFDDRNRGSIWKNDRKESENHPDFTGNMNVDGRDYWVSAWKRKEGASDRAPALSFSFKPKDGTSQARDDMRTAHAKTPQKRAEPMDDDIPF